MNVGNDILTVGQYFTWFTVECCLQAPRNPFWAVGVWGMSWWEVADGAALSFSMGHVAWTPRQPASVAAPVWDFAGSDGSRQLGGAPVDLYEWCAF